MVNDYTIPAERRRRLLAILRAEGWARIASLSETLGASAVTIRRDLDYLDSQGLLERTRGGAILTQRLGQEPLFVEENQHLREAKARIGRLAASLAQPGETVFVNSGSTNLLVLRALNSVLDLRVVTTNAAAILEMDEKKQLVIVGGRYRHESKSFVGPLAEQALRRMYADRAFIGVDGVSAVRGLTTPNLLESENARLMIRQSLGPITVVADHTKMGVVANFAIEPISVVSTLVTDRSLPENLSHALFEAGIEVLIAHPQPKAEAN
jgi:DeoR/GlpR family transcriptional regulator of sugar metabolism